MPQKILKALTWESLDQFKDCKACALCKNRTKQVFGHGNKKASILLIGEGPGADEDTKGLPWIGPMGKILRELLEESGLDENNIFFTNSVICRPPQNRTPKPQEVIECFQRLKMEIRLVRPEWIIYCGKRAETIKDLNPNFKEFFDKYKTWFINHPGSIRYNSDRRDLILFQLKNFKKVYEK